MTKDQAEIVQVSHNLHRVLHKFIVLSGGIVHNYDGTVYEVEGYLFKVTTKDDDTTASSTVPANEQVPDSQKGTAQPDNEVSSGDVQPAGAGEDPAADWESKHGGGTTSDIDDWEERTFPKNIRSSFDYLGSVD